MYRFLCGLLLLCSLSGAVLLSARSVREPETADESSGVTDGTGTALSGTLFLDGQPVSGRTDIPAGPHRVTAQAEADSVWIAVYEGGQMKALSSDRELTCTFPESGAEIALFCLSENLRPVQEAVWAVQGTIPDGVYRGSAQCLGAYMNYLVDLDVTVENGLVTALTDSTLRTPLSHADKSLYDRALRGISEQLTGVETPALDVPTADAVSGATASSTAINAAVADALEQLEPPETEAGTVYAPEGISLYVRTYPIATVRDGKLTELRLVPAANCDTVRLEAFAEEIVSRQSVEELAWPAGIEDDAFALANLTDQILYGEGVLQ